MGIEYRLVKYKTGEAYDLGKTAMRPPPEGYNKLTKGIHPIKNHFAWASIMTPSMTNMWEIGSTDGNCQVTRLPDRWNRETLAQKINLAVFNEDDDDAALAIADDILAWAGNDEVIMLPDNIDIEAVEERLGIKIKKPRITREIYNVVY